MPQTNWDPHYRLMDGVGTTPSVAPEAGRSRKIPSAGALMDAHKEEIMELMLMVSPSWQAWLGSAPCAKPCTLQSV